MVASMPVSPAEWQQPLPPLPLLWERAGVRVHPHDASTSETPQTDSPAALLLRLRAASKAATSTDTPPSAADSPPRYTSCSAASPPRSSPPSRTIIVNTP